MGLKDTIIALATPAGSGAIATIRLSGEKAIEIVSLKFKSLSGKKLAAQKSHTIHLGHIIDEVRTLDEVLVSIFRDPNSYTGENVIEISCHGSPYIQQQIIQLFLRAGCRSADAGEFTLRAFLNGKLDLSQAEAVADLISSENEASHQIAMNQMRGGFSSEIKALREELLNFASLIELELDFSEEDVEFADKAQFKNLSDRIENTLNSLIDSFAVGNVIKNGIPVAIIGEPNVGKSTLLNTLLKEERALVSEIAGTTRDSIEDEISIGGVGFRFIDTAGIRDTTDLVEGMGIQRTFEKVDKSQIVIYLVEASKLNIHKAAPKEVIKSVTNKYPEKQVIIVGNKMDKLTIPEIEHIKSEVPEMLLLSAKEGDGVEYLKKRLLEFVNTGALRNNETIVTNSRHYDSLLKALEEIQKVKSGMDEGVSGDLLAVDIKAVLDHLGEITGQVTNDELLGNIFANFCIGK
ncbi:MAG: tRNA uridine-5-carboxymethylaminomethyl(34) synthesis GTPase MnmE [Aurantibacter sp.]